MSNEALFLRPFPGHLLLLHLILTYTHNSVTQLRHSGQLQSVHWKPQAAHSDATPQLWHSLCCAVGRVHVRHTTTTGVAAVAVGVCDEGGGG